MKITEELKGLKAKFAEKVNKVKESRDQKRAWAKEFTETNKGKCGKLISKEVNGKIYKITWIFELSSVSRNEVLPCYTINGTKIVELYPKCGEIYFKNHSCLYDADDDLIFDSFDVIKEDMNEVLKEYLG